MDLFEFASRFYGDKSYRRKEQTVRGTVKGLKTAFVVNLKDTEDRLDPPFYLFRYQAGDLIAALTPLGETVEEGKTRFRPTTEDELDNEYPMLSVSSDGKVTLNEYVRGESFTRLYRPKKVRHNDFVYNPMRANIGSIGLVPKELDGSLTSPDYVVFRSKKLNPEFLLSLLRSPFYRMYIDVVSTGSIRDRLYFQNLREMRVPEVDTTEQAVVAEMIRRTELEMEQLLEELAVQKAKGVNRLHRLVDASGAQANRNVKAAFAALADQWKRETGMLSSVSRKIQHPAYKKIIALGEPAIPLILHELKERPGHWFAALEALTEASPLPAAGRVDMSRAAAAWLDWGKQHGYLA